MEGSYQHWVSDAMHCRSCDTAVVRTKDGVTYRVDFFRNGCAVFSSEVPGHSVQAMIDQRKLRHGYPNTLALPLGV